MHGPAYPKGDLAYVSYGGAGMVVLDISDITLPQLVGQLKHHPPLAGKLSGARCHTVLPLSQRAYAVMTSEGERYHYFNEKIIAASGAQPLNIIGMVDISDPTDPTLISIFPYPEIPAEWPYKNFNDIPGVGVGPFGPHNIHEPHYHPALEDRNDRIYCCYFHAGLRVYDISDPFVPQGDRLLHPAGPAEVAVQQQDRRPLPRPAHRHGRGHRGGQPGQHLHRYVHRRASTCCAARCSGGRGGAKQAPKELPWTRSRSWTAP